MPRASATRWRSSTRAGLRRDGSRSSGRETSARATCEATSIRLAGSMRMPRREMSPSSSPCGQRPQDVGELVARFGGRRVGQGGVNERLTRRRRAYQRGLRGCPRERSLCLQGSRDLLNRRSARAPERQATGRARLFGPGGCGSPGAAARVRGPVRRWRSWGRTRDAGTRPREPAQDCYRAMPSRSHSRSRRGPRGQGRPRLRGSSLRVAGGVRERGASARSPGRRAGGISPLLAESHRPAESSRDRRAG